MDLQGNPVTKLVAGTSTTSTSEVFIGGRHWGTDVMSSSLLFMHSDWLGTGRVWTNLSASVVQDCQSFPFGDSLYCAGSANNTDDNLAGMTYDLEDGMYHASFREYSPVQGRWMRPDPAGLAAVDPSNPQTWNRYAYVTNNPLSLVDPFGTDSCPPGQSDNCVDVVATAPSVPTFTIDLGGIFPSNPYGYGGARGNSVLGFVKHLHWPKTKAANNSGNAANNGFTKLFLPGGFGTYQGCSVGDNSFYAPLSFDIAKIEAAGQANGLNPFALNANVGQYGTFDFQRSRDSAGNTTFYSGFTNVSNFSVGVYLQSAGYSQWAGSAIANGFALLRSSNFGDPNQALYRNLGFDTAAKGQVPACLIEPED
jgi:RHS repeat-associated protein